MSRRVLYELSGKDNRRFSPFCWRARLCLAHKGLDAELVPVGFTRKEPIAFSSQDRVPVLVDGSETVCGSWAIAAYLERAYPDRPSLFGGTAAETLAGFVEAWADRVVFRGLVPLVLCDVDDVLEPADAAYVRQTRQRELGKSYEEMRAERHALVGPFRDTLSPLRARLRAAPYLAGAAPAYADYSVFGFFQWARMVSSFAVLAPDDPVSAWRARLLAAFGGLAGAAAHRGD